MTPTVPRSGDRWSPRSGAGRSLRWRLVGVLLAVSLTPLCVVSLGAWATFGRMLEGKAEELQRAVVRSHARSIEASLSDQRHLLQLVGSAWPVDDLVRPVVLERLLISLNAASGGAFVDLGVIAADGSHLAYAGPYELLGRNYHDTEWFREVRARGQFVSDVFLGYRGVPHVVIAVAQRAPTEPWILRATINSEKLDALVQTGELGPSGEAFLVNRQGAYQTTPRLGSVLDRSEVPLPEPHSGVLSRRMTLGPTDAMVSTAWINDGRWLLVVRQDAAEVREPVNRAVTAGAYFVVAAVALVVLTTVGATWHLGRQIDRATRQRDELSRAFMRSARLASVGELATGLAHEINNPLAIIASEQTNVRDLLAVPFTDGIREEIADSLDRIRRQVQRCSSITTRMLQFGRQRETTLEATDLAPRLAGIVELMDRQARVRNITLVLQVEDGLPPVRLDPVELEQVLVNLLTNAFAALPDGGRVRVASSAVADRVHLEVEDDGLGMPPEVRERVFEPFFTTKPVGQGTGLGLSVCYGLVQSWGGRIEVESAPGEGTVVRVVLAAEADEEDVP